MDEKIKKEIIKSLIDTKQITAWQELSIENETVAVDEESVVSEDIGISSDGTKYIKSLVSQYLSEKGYPFTQENVDMAAKMFEVNGNSFVKQNNNGYVTKTILDELGKDEIDSYIWVKILEQLVELNKKHSVKAKMEYHVEKLLDKRNGGTSMESFTNILNRYAAEGWRLKQVYTNERGYNSRPTVVGVNINDTIDETIIVFERPVSIS